MSFVARPPDYALKFLNKRTQEKGCIGSAWLNPNGSISIILKPKVVLSRDPDETIALFPKDFVEREVAS